MILPAALKKKISFQRMPYRHVEAYEIYIRYEDPSSDSGFRIEQQDTIPNTPEPSVSINRIPLEYNRNATWKLPKDAYLDHDHKFRLFLNDVPLANICYNYNRVYHLISLDTEVKKYGIGDKLELEYYQDFIKKEYIVTQNCEFFIKPVFRSTYLYGNHNVII